MAQESFKLHKGDWEIKLLVSETKRMWGVRQAQGVLLVIQEDI